jgi:hypothetical protein
MNIVSLNKENNGNVRELFLDVRSELYGYSLTDKKSMVQYVAFTSQSESVKAIEPLTQYKSQETITSDITRTT